MRVLLPVLLWLSTIPSAFATMQAREVEWELDGIAFQGYLVYDAAVAGQRPGLVMVPNWMGVDMTQVEKAKRIAGDDYVVLVADVYGREVRPQNRNEAASAARNARADIAALRARALKAVQVLREQATVSPLDPARIGAIGFCFGGSTVLELARAGADIAGVASFHGGLATSRPAEKGAVAASVLVLNGASDTSVSREQIEAFQTEMDAAGADWAFVDFSDAVHCFAEFDADSPPNCVHHERQARRAFAFMDDFFAQLFARVDP